MDTLHGLLSWNFASVCTVGYTVCMQSLATLPSITLLDPPFAPRHMTKVCYVAKIDRNVQFESNNLMGSMVAKLSHQRATLSSRNRCVLRGFHHLCMEISLTSIPTNYPSGGTIVRGSRPSNLMCVVLTDQRHSSGWLDLRKQYPSHVSLPQRV
jgi:hypothetical protein